MSQTTTTTLRSSRPQDFAQLDEASSHGVIKGILIAVGIAVIAAAVATIFSRRGYNDQSELAAEGPA